MTEAAKRGGLPIYLRQLATIHPATADQVTAVTADGVESVLINIVRQPGANTVAVAGEVQREMARPRPALPAGVSVRTFYDQAVLVREAVANARDAALIAAAARPAAGKARGKGRGP